MSTPTKILVADDSTTIQKVIRLAFAKAPVAIETAISKVEAKNCLRESRPDVLIVDSCLPGTHGVSDLKALADFEPGLPCVVLVGSYDGGDVEGLKNAGFEHIVKKPFHPQDVVHSVEGVLARSLSEPSLVPPPPPPPPPLRGGAKVPPPPGGGGQTLGGLAKGDPGTEARIREMVHDYCEKHFKAIAQEVIQKEIRKLLDDKSRSLVDN